MWADADTRSLDRRKKEASREELTSSETRQHDAVLRGCANDKRQWPNNCTLGHHHGTPR